MDDAVADTATARHPDLVIRWSPDYHSEWDALPGAYVTHGVVNWGRSRRLARADDHRVAFKAYLGVQHQDPARWHVAGAARSVFFLSLFIANQTVSLRTYPTLPMALAELRRFHDTLRPF